MSFLAKFTIDDDTMIVLECTFAFEQGADHTGRPSQKPKGGQIELLIESTNKTDFLDWVISPTMTKSGQLIFYKRDNLSSLKTVDFSDAFCLSYIEHFNASDNEPLKTKVVISAKDITVSDTTFSNNWPAR